MYGFYEAGQIDFAMARTEIEETTEKREAADSCQIRPEKIEAAKKRIAEGFYGKETDRIIARKLLS